MSAERKCLHFKHICGCVYLYHVLLQKEATRKCTGIEGTHVQFVELFQLIEASETVSETMGHFFLQGKTLYF